jgi:choline dehydrogenase
MMEREEDRATLRRGIMLSREIYATAPMGDLVECETLPGADVVSDEGLNAHLRKHVGIVHHPVGTCAMGHGPAAVVDPQLRVHGLDGLRVVDASIMPTLPGGNTNAPTIMVAERASDLIRGRKPPAPAEHASWNG